MKIKTLTSLLVISLCGPLSAQHAQEPHPCGANDQAALEAHFADHPEELLRIAEADTDLEQFTQAWIAAGGPAQRNDYVVPVVFHIIHDNGPENISDAQVEDAMRVLNEDFNRQNSDWDNVRPEFLGLVADVGVEFRLARRDPQGNCTNGITRTQSTLTYQGDQAMKNLIQWPRNRYLNVWVAASANGAAGYTFRPGGVSNAPTLDGIVLLHDYTGSIGTSSPGRSRTLTHEVGHWINLAHTWGNSNNPALSSNCNDDDSVSDTPNTVGWQSCSLSGTSCGSLDNVENYMEYSYCSKMFTNGQAARMLAALNSGTAQRNQLWQASNLAFTGVDGPGALCMARFSGSSRSVCQGAEVTYTDESYNNVTSRLWSFPGGTPSSSTEGTPTVLYEEPGVYPVSLTVSDGTTNLTSTENNFITVLADPGAPVPLEEGFEAYTSLGDAPWSVVNPTGDNGFALTEAASFSGSKSVRLVNQSAMSGTVDELVSNTFDMSQESSIRISFRYAFARRSSSNEDRLRVHVSNNCGQSWSVRQQLRAQTNLPTAPNTTASFVPNGPDQWAFSELTNISSNFLTSDFRLKFEFESDGGNNLYIDDININGSPVSVEELAGDGDALRVVPNPAKHRAQVRFSMERSEPVRLELLDVLGRQVALVHEGPLPAGEQLMDLSLVGLNSGLYFIRLQQGATSRVVRLVRE